jgi:hypothetical protein
VGGQQIFMLEDQDYKENLLEIKLLKNKVQSVDYEWGELRACFTETVRKVCG